MAFRTVLIEKAVNIRLDLNNIVVNYENDKFWINIDEISTLIIDDPRCNVSLRLLSYLCEKGIAVLFCNSSHMPVGTLTTLQNHARASKKIREQILWEEQTLDYLWTEIVKFKIYNQRNTLNKLRKYDKLEQIDKLCASIIFGDKQNREGTVSRIYFKELFGSQFTRDSDCIENYCLNYVYQIIRSKISQEIVSLGFIPSIGIHHKSEFNSFNLSDDFIEVFRPICDYYIYNCLQEYDGEFLTSELKYKLVNILNQNVSYNGGQYKLHSVIQFYLQNLFSFIEDGDLGKLKFPSL